MFKITFNDGFELECSEQTDGVEILKKHSPENSVPIVAWHVDGYLRPLDWTLASDAQVDWVDLNSSEGVDVYKNTLSFILIIATKRVLGHSIRACNSISEGIFWLCESSDSDMDVSQNKNLTRDDIERIKTEVDALIAANLQIRTENMAIDKARRYFRDHGREGKANLLGRSMSEQPVELVELDGVKDMFFGPLLPSTGYAKVYELSYLAPGMVLRFPTLLSRGKLPAYKPSKKLQKVFLDDIEWMKKMNAASMTQMWDAIARDGGKELILVSEALHAQQISDVCDDFLASPEHKAMMIAGPSASGKTTTSHKLRIQLQLHGKHPIALSLDDYFVDREKCPRDENGEYDFEALGALNLDLFNEQINALFKGKTVCLPRFNFYTGKSEPNRDLTLHPDDVLIIEGLHGLNDKILNVIPSENRYGIFLCPMTGIYLDRHTRMGTTDLRLLRRMLRDSRTRGNCAESTFERWPSVVRGAMKYIFPYQGNADAMINSSLLYELPVMRPYAEIQLRSVALDSPAHGEAMRLLRMLRDVPIINPELVPSNSLLREFIGGSIIEI